MRIALAVAVLLWSAAAGADLYRWVDPETGSVKFSSYPPPWYGDEAKQRRAPKVELIPARSDVVVKPETPGVRLEGSGRRDDAKKSPGGPVKDEPR